MPLSEHEQRLLDQIERALYQEDPKFASTVRETDLRTHMRRRMRRASLVFVLGVVLLLVGVVSGQAAVGIAGFIVMVGALLLAMTSWKRLQPGPPLRVAGGTDASTTPPTSRRAPKDRPGRTKGQGRPGRQGASRPPRPSRPAAEGSFKDRIEQRWKRRWDERGGPQ